MTASSLRAVRCARSLAPSSNVTALTSAVLSRCPRCRGPTLLQNSSISRPPPHLAFSSSSVATDPRSRDDTSTSAATEHAPTDDRADTQESSPKTGSSKLFEDAAREEEEEELRLKKDRLVKLIAEDTPWTGEESQHDAVLRMLVDKHKPLRGARSSDPLDPVAEKMKSVQKPTYISPNGTQAPASEKGKRPLEAESELTGPKNPWDFDLTFVRPSHTVSNEPSVRYGTKHLRLGSSSQSRLPLKGNLPVDDPKAMRAIRETVKTARQKERIVSAKESVVDYRLDMMDRRAGVRDRYGGGGEGGRRPMPQSIRAWRSLVDERIEQARQAGHFDKNRLRGKPLPKDANESNPYIGREEFLMNRMIQRQGAAPPWVELQGELESDVNSFRLRLRSNWVRRASRMILSNPSLSLNKSGATSGPAAADRDGNEKPTMSVARAYSDPEWVEKERRFHEKEVEMLNDKVRRYNGIAPYVVRKPYVSLSAELEACFHDSVTSLASALDEALNARRFQGAGSARTAHLGPAIQDDEDGGVAQDRGTPQRGGGEGGLGLVAALGKLVQWARIRVGM